MLYLVVYYIFGILTVFLASYSRAADKIGHYVFAFFLWPLALPFVVVDLGDYFYNNNKVKLLK